MKWYPMEKDRRSDLQKEIDRLYSLMQETNPLSDDYEKLQDRYCALMEQKLKEKSKLPSADAIASGLFSLAGLELMLHHERYHVIGSKACNFVLGLFRRT